jgi:cytidine deaminase
MTIASATLAELRRRARDAATRAYAPYSRFPVGAAVLAADGTIHAGANVENASYGLSICAERAAIFQAVAQGTRKIEAIVIYTPTPAATAPCGACRQVIHEFGPGALVVCCTDDEQAERRYALAELLPVAFATDALAGRR